ncbi:phosphoenolpyruvate-utilizing protein [Amycolatopsis sp. K13G38]|uniref:Phosphoenolpyruvate-utilizing protein n=1 Tax=Amycolatopsis acididurans TaxID=2724524 RepID=A0ABX1J7F1_9PSEU|nr:PEP-utilizing enzyme [Amycolatopsis acididurans]NKQ54271.1 phosphoenolpyruvate-utilizing protein [Amycolatopsis acididurans]
MVDISRPWIVDTPLSERWPVYTRANVGEVSPNATTPLMWSMIGGPPAEREWKQALVEFGAFDIEEFRPDLIDIQGMVHGYIYLNLSNSRTFGARMPGATPELMDRTYLGEIEAPPYVPHPDDDKPGYTERILATVQRVLGEKARPDVAEHKKLAAKLRAERPDLTALSDSELLARQRSVMEYPYGPTLRTHLRMVYEGSVVTGALDQAVAGLGDPTLAIRLMSGLGDIASAAPNQAMWQLGRMVTASPELTAEFDKGVAGLEERLRSSGSETAQAFLSEFDAFIYEYGSRSTDEWSAAPKSWETHPSIPLGMIDRMRLQDDEKEPGRQAARLRGERQALVAEVTGKLSDNCEALSQILAVLESAELYSRAREQSKTNCIRMLHEARLPVWELGKRYTAKGVLGRPEDITMLLESELDAFIANPQSFVPVIAERWEWYDALDELEPPFFINGEIPPVTTWPKKKDPDLQPAGPGTVLTGIGACPGTATGVARVITDPEDAPDLEPGEILVAPLTDPGWTPIFTSAAAVVVNVGAPMSHAAIVSRELGIPCVLGVRGATKKIKDGTRLTVNGTTGEVTVE